MTISEFVACSMPDIHDNAHRSSYASNVKSFRFYHWVIDEIYILEIRRETKTKSKLATSTGRTVSRPITVIGLSSKRVVARHPSSTWTDHIRIQFSQRRNWPNRGHSPRKIILPLSAPADKNAMHLERWSNDVTKYVFNSSSKFVSFIGCVISKHPSLLSFTSNVKGVFFKCPTFRYLLGLINFFVHLPDYQFSLRFYVRYTYVLITTDSVSFSRFDL